jgi:hypothetical protein
LTTDRCAAQIVGDHHQGASLLKVGRFVFTGFESHELRRLIPAPEDPVRGTAPLFQQEKPGAVLLQPGAHVPHTMRIRDPHVDRRCKADYVDLGLQRQDRTRRQEEERGRTYDHEKGYGDDCFHGFFGSVFLGSMFLGSMFLTQESIQSINVLYQSKLF